MEYSYGDTIIATFVNSGENGIEIIKKSFFVIASRKVRYGGKFDYTGTVKKTLYTIVESEGQLRGNNVKMFLKEVDGNMMRSGRKLLSEKL